MQELLYCVGLPASGKSTFSRKWVNKSPKTRIRVNRDDIRRLFLSVSWFDQFSYQGETIECCHYPISSWNKLRKGRVHLHGHCHLPFDKRSKSRT